MIKQASISTPLTTPLMGSSRPPGPSDGWSNGVIGFLGGTHAVARDGGIQITNDGRCRIEGRTFMDRTFAES